MLPLKIAVLWHQHQPYYKKDGEFILPWVRFHSVKDYFDLAELLNDYPSIKQTFNLVPSMMLQIEEYIKGVTIDKIQRLTAINPENLTEDQKKEIYQSFFLCNAENMIDNNTRYVELYRKSSSQEDAVQSFTTQDWRDLQVWYNLTWFGQCSRERGPIKRLFRKGKDFTEEEKNMCMSLQLEVLSLITPTMKSLKNLGQIEISCSPMQHPILPLLCDSASALESMPGIQLPEPLFRYKPDAVSQINDAVSYYHQLFGDKPKGMWPSEGSVSDEVLGLIAESGLKWAATDDQVLYNSSKDDYKPLEKYFPRKFKKGSNEITLFFRDHQLSDAIGFVYSRWHHFDAVNDFMHKLRHIRSELINNYGEGCLEHAVVPVILDGENCWEFYKDNGWPFLRELYDQLSKSSDFKTITMSESISPESTKYLKPLEHIQAGSWINGDFRIWIGSEQNVTAWSVLSKARLAVEQAKSKLSAEDLKKAMDEIFIAEGSDWFWWYCDDHNAPNKGDFDILFRWHISEIYKIIGMEPPIEIKEPITKSLQKINLVQQSGIVSPVIDGKKTSEIEWDNAGCFDAGAGMSAMHQVGEILHKLWFASDESNLYLRIDTKDKLKSDELIELKFESPARFSLIIYQNSFEFNSDEELKLKHFSWANDELIEISISRGVFKEQKSIELLVRTKTAGSEIWYPRQGSIVIKN